MDICVVCCRGISDMRTEDIKVAYTMDKKDGKKDKKTGTKISH
jgi:hypothetical protein